MVDDPNAVSAAKALCKIRSLAPFAAAIALLSPAAARAQAAPPNTAFNAERMRISLDSAGIIDTEWSAVPDHLTFEVGLWADFEHNELEVYQQSDGKRLGPLLRNRVAGSLMGSVGLFGFAELGIEIPAILSQNRPSEIPGATAQPLPALSTSHFGDIRIEPKIQLLRASVGFVDIAVIPSFTVPTAKSTAYAGEKGAAFAPELAISKAFAGGLRASVNLGAYFRRAEQFLDETVGNELEGRLGIGYRFQEANAAWIPLALDVGFSGVTSAPHPFTDKDQNALEIRGEASYRFIPWMQAFVGGGGGIGHAVGNPDVRVFGGLRFIFGRPAPEPVPVVKFENKPLPEPSSEVKAELKSEVPPPAPVVVAPPPPAPAVVVPAPAPAKTELALPPAPPADLALPAPAPRAKLTEGKIEIAESVQFEPSKDVISPRSFGLLDDVAGIMKAHPETAFTVDGHTDNAGKRKENLELSMARAKSVVRYLIGKGIAPEKLTAEGFGDTKPVASNKTTSGRAANRRVEFHVAGKEAKGQ